MPRPLIIPDGANCLAAPNPHLVPQGITNLVPLAAGDIIPALAVLGKSFQPCPVANFFKPNLSASGKAA